MEKIIPYEIKLSCCVIQREAVNMVCFNPDQFQPLKFVNRISYFKINMAIPSFGQPVFNPFIELFFGQLLICGQQKIVSQRRFFELFFLGGIDQVASEL